MGDTPRQRAAKPLSLLYGQGSLGRRGAPEKLPLVKKPPLAALNAVRPADKVSIVTYAGGAGVLLGPTEVKHTATIRAKVTQLKAGGGTWGAGGIKAAYARLVGSLTATSEG